MRWRRRTPNSSQAVQERIEHANRELVEAKEMRREAAELAKDLDYSRAVNHFGLSLEIAMRGRI